MLKRFTTCIVSYHKGKVKCFLYRSLYIEKYNFCWKLMQSRHVPTNMFLSPFSSSWIVESFSNKKQPYLWDRIIDTVFNYLSFACVFAPYCSHFAPKIKRIVWAGEPLWKIKSVFHFLFWSTKNAHNPLIELWAFEFEFGWKKKIGTPFRVSRFWCEKRDLNPYAFRHTPLKRACLPIPALSQLQRQL